MTPEGALAAYRRMFEQRGAQTVSLRRWAGQGNDRAALVSEGVGAVFAESREEALAGNMKEGETAALMIFADVAALMTVPGEGEEAESWPGPIRRGDEVALADGRVLKVEHADIDRRKLGDTPICYELRLRG